MDHKAVDLAAAGQLATKPLSLKEQGPLGRVTMEELDLIPLVGLAAAAATLAQVLMEHQ
jgi:alpha-tubulin suppressor-like RCC1 family protein